jgi:hypothetical protein
MQSRGAILGAKRVDGDSGCRNRNERVVDVEVELLECRHQFRVLADLRTDRDQLSRRRVDEVPMRRYLSHEQIRWIGEARAGECKQRDRSRDERDGDQESSLHKVPLSVAIRPLRAGK